MYTIRHREYLFDSAIYMVRTAAFIVLVNVDSASHIYILWLYCPWKSNDLFSPLDTSGIVYTDLWGKVQQRQVNVDIVMTSGSLCGVMVAHWSRMSDVGLIHALGTIIPIFNTPTTMVPWLGSCTSYVLNGWCTYSVYVYVRPLPVYT